MPIPQNIKQQHIIRAMKKIDCKGFSKVNRSRKCDLEFDKGKYPPKYTISQANDFAGNKALPVSDFFGGTEANSFLIARGFKICDKKGNPI